MPLLKIGRNAYGLDAQQDEHPEHHIEEQGRQEENAQIDRRVDSFQDQPCAQMAGKHVTLLSR